jgi:hypothetical protein
MDVSDLRKRILRALDEARVEAATKRAGVEVAKRAELDEAQRAYDKFLDTIAVPLLKQTQDILKAERKPFTVHTPVGSARLASDTESNTFLEFQLQTSTDPAQVIGKVSRARGRQRVVVDERPVADGKAVAALTDEDVAAFLVTEIPKLVRG